MATYVTEIGSYIKIMDTTAESFYILTAEIECANVILTSLDRTLLKLIAKNGLEHSVYYSGDVVAAISTEIDSVFSP